MKSFTIIFIVLVLVSGCRNSQPKEVSVPLTPVKVIKIAPEDISIPVHTSGILLSSDQMKLSFKTGGIVASIPVREGDKVKKGQVIARLNLSEINAQAGLAANGYEKALRDYNRAKNLYSDSVATLEQFQNATTALDVAKSNLEIARFNLSHSTITAPDNGVILKQLARENELVSAGYPVLFFGASGKSWRVKSGLADREVVKINPGDSASVTFDAWPGVKFRARVDLIGEMANQATGTYDAELTLDNEGYRFATGFIASVDIYPSKKDSYLLVPVGAIIEADVHSGYLFTVSDSSVARKIRISIIAVTGNRAGISGIPGNISEIVTEGAAYLRDGEKVRVIR